jgi:hypothetical protein
MAAGIAYLRLILILRIGFPFPWLDDPPEGARVFKTPTQPQQELA